MFLTFYFICFPRKTMVHLLIVKQGQNHEKKTTTNSFHKMCNNEFTVAGKNQLKRIYTSYVCQGRIKARAPPTIGKI